MTDLIYFADLTHTGTITNNDTFPLGIGYIASYAKKIFGDDLECEIFKFPQELNDALLRRTPRLLAFSYFQWNANLTMAFANYIKKQHPEVVVVMGGQNISLSKQGREEFLKKHPVVDFYIKWEGEYAFADLYRLLIENDHNPDVIREKKLIIDNCIYRANGVYVEGPDVRIMDLMTVPSPYTAGLFDKFFDQGLRPCVETTRGCPYGCTFCCDAPSQRNKVMRRTTEDIREEMEYITTRIKSPVDLVWADLNFGMYKEDLDTARIIRSMIDIYDWPKTISCSPGKTHPDRVLETVKIINGSQKGVLKFASSLESTDQDVLNAIKRKNLPMEKIIPVLQVRDSSEEDNTEYFTELILALPGDSKEKHFKSLRESIDLLGMDVVNVHQLALLQGAPMALKEQRELYGFNTRHRVYVGALGMYKIGNGEQAVTEVEEIVVANNTMTHEEWIECRIIDLLVKIYIDRDYFLEVFGLIRRLGLSCFDLLLHLRDNYISKYPELSKLIDLYKDKTIEPLHKSLDKLMEFVSHKETIKKYITGEIGGNEFVVHRAKAYLYCNNELHSALKDATISYLAKHDLLNKEMEEYVNQAVIYSKLRKVNFVDYENSQKEMFKFDFIAARKKHFQVIPSEVRIDSGEILFSLGQLARKELEYALKQHLGRGSLKNTSDRNQMGPTWFHFKAKNKAQFDFNMGKLFHMSNLKVIRRTAQFIN